jgi:asparagine synthase (glutamine-hydrolysing)
MCGFAGIFNYGSPDAVSRDVLKQMADTIVHRGPDDEGFVVLGNVGLAFRRLSIIDLSMLGHQPMSTPERDVWIVFNGEIYNFREIRRDLISRGVQFRSQSDTEVFLHAYREFGSRCVEMFNGMFAFALWDVKRSQLLLGRDRLGKKPLYYTDNGSRLVFGSEIKAILAAPDVSREVSPAAVEEYFTFGYVGAGETIYRSVKRVPPASTLCLAPQKRELQRYWSPSSRMVSPLDATEAALRVEQTLEDAVRIRLESDVPLGAFLSGGIDSSLVVAMMARTSSRPVQTFTIGFKDDGFNEADEARVVAHYLGTSHSEEVIDPDYAGLIETILTDFDEPFGDSSALPTFVVSKMTRRHVTVVLSGDGGDEVFGGYDLHRIAHREASFDLLPSFARSACARVSAVYPESWRGGNMLRRASLKGMADRYVDRFQLMNAAERSRLLRHGWRQSETGINPCASRLEQFSRTTELASLTRLQLNDMLFYLPDDILVKVDRMSMLNSLETRAPFLDHRVVELGLGLPMEMKLQDGVGKKILRDLTRKLLPPEVSLRPKRGFAIPLARWFREDLREYARDMVFSGTMRDSGFLDLTYADQLFKIHEKGMRDVSRALWLMLAFSVWVKASGANAGMSSGTEVIGEGAR